MTTVSKIRSVSPVRPVGAEEATLDQVALATSVSRHVRRGATVVALAADAELKRSLVQSGCTLSDELAPLFASWRATGQGLEALRRGLSAIAPDVVVVVDELPHCSRPEEFLRTLAAAAPGATLLLSTWNASSASHLLDCIAGRATGRASASDFQVKQWLAATGFLVRHREAIPVTERPLPLAADAEEGLRKLFEQLGAFSADARCLYVAEAFPGAAAGRLPGELVPGLLSVIIRHHSLERVALLDQALFSLACQEYQPLEVVVVSQCPDPDTVPTLQRVLERQQKLGDFTFQILHLPATEDRRAMLVNRGVEAANGQYLAVLDDDDVVYPAHYRRLIASLRAGTEAWAVGRTRRASFTRDARGELFCESKADWPFPERFSVSHLLRENFIPCHSFVLDRSRLGRFPIAFAEEMPRCEDYVFLIRLAALFRPRVVAGPPSCEYRLRDDGSNSTPTEGIPEQVRRELEGPWALAHALLDVERSQLQLRLGAKELSLELSAHQTAGFEAGTRARRKELRYRLVDSMNETIKQRLPRAHALLRSLTSAARDVLRSSSRPPG